MGYCVVHLVGKTLHSQFISEPSSFITIMYNSSDTDVLHHSLLLTIVVIIERRSLNFVVNNIFTNTLTLKRVPTLHLIMRM